MEFMLLIVDRKGASTGEPAGIEEMGRFAGALASEGKIRGGSPLHPESAGARVQLRGGRVVVSDGPFAECKEVIAGYILVAAGSRAEAIAIARRCPHVRSGIVEVREAPDRDVVESASGTEPRFLFLLHMEPSLTDPDRSKYREMVRYDEELKREGRYVESSQLALDPPARVETRGGKPLVVDGPFAETKEVAGGYYVVQAASRAEAIELAKRCPHARWGSVEVREIFPVGRG